MIGKCAGYKLFIIQSLNITPSDNFKATAIYRSYKSPPPIPCSNGPIYTEYHEDGYLFWPPLTYQTCSGLTCKQDRECVPAHKCIKYRWVFVFECDWATGCKPLRYRYLSYIEDLECHCKRKK